MKTPCSFSLFQYPDHHFERNQDITSAIFRMQLPLVFWHVQLWLHCEFGSGILNSGRANFMELFGIAFSIPVALVASMLYCFFLDRVVLKCERASRWLRLTSYFVLAFFVAELGMLVTLGTRTQPCDSRTQL